MSDLSRILLTHVDNSQIEEQLSKLPLDQLREREELGEGIESTVRALYYNGWEFPVFARKVFHRLSFDVEHEYRVGKILNECQTRIFTHVYFRQEKAIISEYVRRNSQEFTVENFFPIFVQVFFGLKETEVQRYNHRDLHFENIIVKDVEPTTLQINGQSFRVNVIPKIFDQTYARIEDLIGKPGTDNPTEYIPLRDIFQFLVMVFGLFPEIQARFGFLLDFFQVKELPMNHFPVPPVKFWNTSFFEYQRYLADWNPIFEIKFDVPSLRNEFLKKPIVFREGDSLNYDEEELLTQLRESLTLITLDLPHEWIREVYEYYLSHPKDYATIAYFHSPDGYDSVSSTQTQTDTQWDRDLIHSVKQVISALPKPKRSFDCFRGVTITRQDQIPWGMSHLEKGSVIPRPFQTPFSGTFKLDIAQEYANYDACCYGRITVPAGSSVGFYFSEYQVIFPGGKLFYTHGDSYWSSFIYLD